MFSLSLRVSFFSVITVFLLVLHLSEENGVTVFRNFLSSVISFMLRDPKNVFLVALSVFEYILRSRLSFCQDSEDLFLLNIFRSLDRFMIALLSVLLIKTWWLYRIFFFFSGAFSFRVARDLSKNSSKWLELASLCFKTFSNYSLL